MRFRACPSLLGNAWAYFYVRLFFKCLFLKNNSTFAMAGSIN